MVFNQSKSKIIHKHRSDIHFKYHVKQARSTGKMPPPPLKYFLVILIPIPKLDLKNLILSRFKGAKYKRCLNFFLKFVIFLNFAPPSPKLLKSAFMEDRQSFSLVQIIGLITMATLWKQRWHEQANFKNGGNVIQSMSCYWCKHFHVHWYRHDDVLKSDIINLFICILVVWIRWYYLVYKIEK